ncbi:MAG: hypothetical protein ABEJ04_00680 [Halobacteriaceae archaeon]
MPVHVGRGEHEYEWRDDWVTVPESDNGRTHGVEVTADGRVVVFHQSSPAVLVYDESGELLDSWGEYPGAHGLTLVETGDGPRLWLTDQESGAVVQTTLEGEVVRELPRPDQPAYDDGEFVPTWVADAGDGTVWVADGYGESLVHRYDGDVVTATLYGTAGAGRFDCPHAVAVDRRGGGPELYVADRGNERVQVFGLDGAFRRAFGRDAFTSPCSFATDGETLVVPELFARVTLLNGDDEVVAHLGENEAVCERDDWPNVPDDALEPGRFNSPHDAAVGPDGSVYVVEWVLDGRVTKLVPA